MTGADTNILIRLITGDDQEQAARAAKLFEKEQIWLAKTVLLETEWVLRSLYGFSGWEVAKALRKLAGLQSVLVEDPLAVSQALLWLDKGLDFADALHVASRGRAAQFASFDVQLAKRAAKLGVSIYPL